MSMKQVGWEYITGVPALLALTDMMEAAITVVMPNAGRKRTAGWSWRGFYLDEVYFFGVRSAEPMLVVFEDDREKNPNFKQRLDLAPAHFFSLGKDKQFECIGAFLKGVAKQLEGVRCSDGPRLQLHPPPHVYLAHARARHSARTGCGTG